MKGSGFSEANSGGKRREFLGSRMGTKRGGKEIATTRSPLRHSLAGIKQTSQRELRSALKVAQQGGDDAPANEMPFCAKTSRTPRRRLKNNPSAFSTLHPPLTNPPVFVRLSRPILDLFHLLRLQRFLFAEPSPSPPSSFLFRDAISSLCAAFSSLIAAISSLCAAFSLRCSASTSLPL